MSAPPKKTLGLLAAFLVLAGLALLLEGPWSLRRKPADEGSRFYTGNPELVDRLEITASDGTVVLTRQGGAWTVAREGKTFPADAEAVRRVVEQFSDLNGGSLVSRGASRHEGFRLDEPNGIRITVSEGGKKTADVLVGGQGPDFFSSYLRKAGASEVYLVKGNLRPLVDRPLKRWRDLVLTSLKAEEVIALEVSGPEVGLRLKKEAGQWTYDPPDPSGPAASAVDDLLARVVSLKAADALDGPPPDPGFTRPTLILRVTPASGGTQEVTVGSLLKEKNQYHARALGKETIFLLGAYTVDDLVRAAGAVTGKKK